MIFAKRNHLVLNKYRLVRDNILNLKNSFYFIRIFLYNYKIRGNSSKAFLTMSKILF